MLTFAVDRFPLDVHDIIIFEQSLTDTKVVFFNFFLRTLDRLGHHRMLDHFSILMTHAVHHLGDPLRMEEPHEVVFQ